MKLLNPKVVVRKYYNLSFSEMKRVITAHKKRKMGILLAAYEVEETEKGQYNVWMEYIAKC